MKSRASLKYVLNHCLWKHIFASISPQDPFKFNLFFFDNFGKSKAFQTVLT